MVKDDLHAGDNSREFDPRLMQPLNYDPKKPASILIKNGSEGCDNCQALLKIGDIAVRVDGFVFCSKCYDERCERKRIERYDNRRLCP